MLSQPCCHVFKRWTKHRVIMLNIVIPSRLDPSTDISGRRQGRADPRGVRLAREPGRSRQRHGPVAQGLANQS